nr:hypothetical protein EOJLPPLO_00081 [Oryctes rhinoceros nudivirus]WDA64658.1 hypothetical protein PIFADJLK_00084 [Oryctes rhinoceros nudivirus]WDA64774.1 hypothetical protein NALGGIOA_00082 [Oryctes rhinoceros nudivirus]WDA64913.1 hypothetical protein NNONMNKP_00098 [Oryctes rhinoceros nudivirus]WDA65035.1 hypothetical protein NFEMFJFI_00085 [Oryctes rhinoceros nudivirus]
MRGTYNIIWKGEDLCAKKGFYVCARGISFGYFVN